MLCRCVWLVGRIGLFCAVFVGSANATCTWVNGASTQTYTISVPALSIPRDRPAGAVLYSAMVPGIPGTGNFASCSSGGTANRTVAGGEQVSTSPYTYKTSVPGVGVRFFDKNGGSVRYWGAGNQESFAGYWVWNGTNVGIELVSLGQVGSGSVSGGTVTGTFALDNLTNANVTFSAFSTTASTCSTSPTIPVELPRVRVSDMPTIGSTAGDQSFGIALTNCPAQLNAIQYQLDAPTGVIDAPSGTFLAKPESSTKGVGLVIKDSSNARVSLGAPHAFSGYNTATGGNYSIPLKAAYIRTGQIVPGNLAGTLIYTVFYQ